MGQFRLPSSYFVMGRSYVAVMAYDLRARLGWDCPCLTAVFAGGCAAVVEGVVTVVVVIAAAAGVVVVVVVEVGVGVGVAAAVAVAAVIVVAAAADALQPASVEARAIGNIPVSRSTHMKVVKRTCVCCILFSCCCRGSDRKFGICSTMYFTNALFGSRNCCTKASPCGPKLLTICCMAFACAAACWIWT